MYLRQQEAAATVSEIEDHKHCRCRGTTRNALFDKVSLVLWLRDAHHQVLDRHVAVRLNFVEDILLLGL